MTETIEFAERRMHERFKAKEGAFAKVKNGSYKLGQIKDISKGGLAFTYPADGHQIPESFRVDVFFGEKGVYFYIEGVPSNKISDVYVSSNFPMSSLIMKKVGVQFAELTQDQPSRLDHFIRSYTTAKE